MLFPKCMYDIPYSLDTWLTMYMNLNIVASTPNTNINSNNSISSRIVGDRLFPKRPPWATLIAAFNFNAFIAMGVRRCLNIPH